MQTSESNEISYSCVLENLQELFFLKVMACSQSVDDEEEDDDDDFGAFKFYFFLPFSTLLKTRGL